MIDTEIEDIISIIFGICLCSCNIYFWTTQTKKTPPINKLHNKCVIFTSFFIFISGLRSIYYNIYSVYINHYSIDIASMILLLGIIFTNQIIIDIFVSLAITVWK